MLYVCNTVSIYVKLTCICWLIINVYCKRIARYEQFQSEKIRLKDLAALLSRHCVVEYVAFIRVMYRVCRSLVKYAHWVTLTQEGRYL